MAKRVLVVGDIMVDRYTYVRTERFAPEASIPVWDEVSHETRLGGAANVAHNLKALGEDDVDVCLAGICGGFLSEIEKISIDTRACEVGQTMVKERYVDYNLGKHVFRSDNFKNFFYERTVGLERRIETLLASEKFDAVVYSDYDKGTISPRVVELTKNLSALTVVDSKRIDLTLFKGLSVLKVNEHEYSIQVSKGPYTNVESLFQSVVVTKGSKGAQVRQAVEQITDRRRENEPEVVQSSNSRYIIDSEDFPTIAVKAIDVTGCGDTHTAAMTFSLLFYDDLRRAVKFANECARNVVQKFGTSVVSR